MIGKAAHFDRILVDADDAIDDPDRDGRSFQNAALLNVQFQIAMHRSGGAQCLRNPVRIATNAAQAVSHDDAIERQCQ